MNRPNHLTKEDLRQYLSCSVKPLYRWEGLPTKNDEDPFLRFLAEEGRVVGRVARRLFRNLVVIDEPFDEAVRSTTQLLEIPSITTAEAAFVWGAWRIRPDILALQRGGSEMTIYEVKAKTASRERDHRGAEFLTYNQKIRSEWREILHDLAVQVVVLEKIFPGRKIRGKLILPETEKAVSVEESVFALSGEEGRPEVDGKKIASRQEESVLQVFDPGRALTQAKSEVEAAMIELEDVRKGEIKPRPQLRYQCRNCEYRLANGRDPNDGFHCCWGDLADPDPHLFDLHQLYQIGGQASYSNRMIAQGTTSLLDVADADLDGSPYANRQKLQLRGVRENKEWVSPDLGGILRNLEYPLRFLDFETSMAAVPWHGGLRPYELLPIQFSQHVLDQNGDLRHEEWLHADRKNPMLPFARALLASVGESGHILIYTDYETKVLRGVIDYLRRTGTGETEAEKLEDLLGSGRIVDQHDILYRHYQHPVMAGRTSLKVVAKAIWTESEKIRNHPWFRVWGSEESTPYDSLAGITVGGKILRVADGCGAMEAYSELYRGDYSTADREEIRTAMLRYCELDTLCQVMIHQHWSSRFARKSGGESQ